MRFIKTLSYKFADSLTKQLNETHQKKSVYYFGFQVVIGAIVKMIIFVILTTILGIFWPTLAVMLFFAMLRLLAGGFHMDTYNKCLVTSYLIFFSLGFLVKYTYKLWSMELLIAFSIIVFAAALISIIKWAPADTPNNPITRPEKIKRLRILSIIMIFVWAAADVVFIYFNLPFYILSGCLGILMAAFIVSPAAYKFFGMIAGIGKRKKRKIRNNTCENKHNEV